MNLPLESNKTFLLLHMHEFKDSAKLHGGSYFHRRSHLTYSTAKDHFRGVYYGALDLVVSVLSTSALTRKSSALTPRSPR